jgi:hypothetical protein
MDPRSGPSYLDAAGSLAKAYKKECSIRKVVVYCDRFVLLENVRLDIRDLSLAQKLRESYAMWYPYTFFISDSI